MPGVVALELLLVANERMAVWLPVVAAYRSGLLLHVDLRGREPARAGVEAGAGTWRFGVQFSDGQKVTTFGLGIVRTGSGPGTSAATVAASSPPASRPSRPQLRGHGGGGGRTVYRQDYWLWPLPPAGELLIACKWPNVGLDLTTTKISTDRLRDAAARSRELWPSPDLPEWPGSPESPPAPVPSQDADELVQIAERALFDAEEAYRRDPSEVNQRRAMRAWDAVRRARDRQRDAKAADAEPPATTDG